METYKFWRATFPADARAMQGALSAATVPLAARMAGGPPVRAGGDVVIEVLCRLVSAAPAVVPAVPSPYMVLLSTIEARGSLKCRLGFSNDAVTCNEYRDMGFPLVGARLDHDAATQTLKVISPHFTEGDTMMALESPLLILQGLAFGSSPRGKRESVDYDQEIVSPDSAQPDTLLRLVPRTWTTQRFRVTAAAPSGTAQKTSARFPDLWPVPVETEPAAAEYGWLRFARQPSLQAASSAITSSPQICKRESLFVPSAFRFEEVESLGFRLDLGPYGAKADDLLDALVAPLNFHFAQAHHATDFRYRAGSRTVFVEMLRYGRMKLVDDCFPLTKDDFQCQHEVVLRLLVGRVVDGTSQARSLAVFVPAIFVDNPWSQILGREVQGLDKRMASFFSYSRDPFATETGMGRGHSNMDVPLLSNGRRPASGAEAAPVPLEQVDRAALASTLGTRSDDTVLEVLLPRPLPDNWNTFDDFDLKLALGRRVTDFEKAEFRCAFARRVPGKHGYGFSSIQAAPVGDRPFSKSWISTDFRIDDLQIGYPKGIASITLHSPLRPDTPTAWSRLCALLYDGTSSQVELSTGDWYRLKCSMTMTVQSGLKR